MGADERYVALNGQQTSVVGSVKVSGLVTSEALAEV